MNVFLARARSSEEQNKLDEAIELYRLYLERNPKQAGWCNCKIGQLKVSQGKLEQGIFSYRKGIECQSQQPAWVYLGLANALNQNGQTEEAIAVYKQAVELHLDNPSIYHGLVALLKIQGREEEAAKWMQQHPQVKKGRIYSEIWQAFNQKSWANLEQNSVNYPTEFNREEVEQHFKLVSGYKTINLTSLSEDDSEFFSSHNISVANLKSIARSSNYNAKEQEVYLKHFNPEFEPASNKSIKPSKYPLYPFLNSMLETGYIYAKCPISGRFLRSDRAFILVPKYVGVLYRFVGDEVFYLLAGWTPGGQFILNAVYFPHLNTIVELTRNSAMNLSSSFDFFKVWLVLNWKLVKNLISLHGESHKKLMCAVEFHFNIGHNLVNDLSGIEVLLQTGLLDKVDKFFVGDHEYFGHIELLYPEIPQDKIIRLKNQNDSNQEVATIALENNYLPLAVRGRWVSEDLASRIYRVSQQKCSQSFLNRVQKAKQHFPLIWISFRVHNRSWISQIEGIANIIASLAADFPNLGVVFDGFSFAECHLEKDDELINRRQDIVKQENDIVTQILDLIAAKNANIGVYNMIGCMMHESIIWAHAVDFYIASMGAGLSKVALLANKPGIQHSCTAYVRDYKNWYNTDFRENAVNPITISEDYIIDRDASDCYCSYDCDWKAIYNEALKVATNLSKK